MTGNSLVGIRFLAQRYGVTSRQIHAWYTRRTQGFPEPVARQTEPQYRGDRVGTPLFDLAAVDAWHETYDPNRLRGSHWAEKRRLAEGPAAQLSEDELAEVVQKARERDPQTSS